jgi:hypothetical protein
MGARLPQRSSERSAGGVEAVAGGGGRGQDAGGGFGEPVVLLVVVAGGVVVAAFGGRRRGGSELVEQPVVEFGGVFGLHPGGVGALQGVLVGSLVAELAVQVGQLCGGGLFGGVRRRLRGCRRLVGGLGGVCGWAHSGTIRWVNHSCAGRRVTIYNVVRSLTTA